MDTTPVKPGCILLTLIGIILIISSGGIIIFWLAYRHGLNMGLSALRELQPPREEPLPPRFSINDTFFIPNHPFSPENSFAFSSIYLLESFYRANGVYFNYLDYDQYLELNQDFLAQTLIQICQSDTFKYTQYCNGNPYPDDILTFSSLFVNNLVYPSQFPQKDLNQTNATCHKKNNSNPLRFTASGSDFFSGVATTKQSLLVSSSPHLMTIPIPSARFWFPCTTDTNSICRDKLFQCNNNRSSYCYFLDFPIESDFVSNENYQIVAGKSQSLILIAYNDYFIPNQLFPSNNRQTGGFIVKNGHGAIGHSLEYLLGAISNQDDNKICPDPNNVLFWIPTTLDCAQLHQKNISECNKMSSVVSGNETIKGSTELLCINDKYCHINHTYAILSNEEDPLSFDAFTLQTGTKLAKVIDLDTLNVFVIDDLPIEFLYYAFKPKVVGTGVYQKCGYLFYAYDSINKLSSKLSSKTENWRIANIKIQWAKQSYPSFYRNYDYTYVIESMRRISDANTSLLF